MLQASITIMSILVLAALVMIWEWRPAIRWHQPTPAKQQKMASVLFYGKAICLTVLRLIAGIFHPKYSTVDITAGDFPHRLGWLTYRGMPWLALVFAVLACLFIPFSPASSLLPSAYSSVFVMLCLWLMVVLLFLSALWCCAVQVLREKAEQVSESSERVNDGDECPRYPSLLNTVIVTSALRLLACVVIFISFVTVAIDLHSFEVTDMVFAQREQWSWWRYGLSLLACMIAVMVLTHRYTDDIKQTAKRKQQRKPLVTQHATQDDGVDSAEAVETSDADDKTAHVSDDSMSTNQTSQNTARANTALENTSSENKTDDNNAAEHVAAQKLDAAHYLDETDDEQLGVWQTPDVMHIYLDYVMMVLVSAMMVLVYFGGWLPMFAMSAWLPEAWFMLKWLLVLLVMLLLRRMIPPFMPLYRKSLLHCSRDVRASSQRHISRSVRWLGLGALPLVIIGLVWQVVW